jgi:hypothetical protein
LFWVAFSIWGLDCLLIEEIKKGWIWKIFFFSLFVAQDVRFWVSWLKVC